MNSQESPAVPTPGEPAADGRVEPDDDMATNTLLPEFKTTGPHQNPAGSTPETDSTGPHQGE